MSGMFDVTIYKRALRGIGRVYLIADDEKDAMILGKMAHGGGAECVVVQNLADLSEVTFGDGDVANEWRREDAQPRVVKILRYIIACLGGKEKVAAALESAAECVRYPDKMDELVEAVAEDFDDGRL